MELIDIIINAAQESFLHVGVLLGVVILIFGYIDYKTSGNIVNILENNKRIQPIIGAILGIIPGCGGSIILIPLYVKNKVSFGALVATLVSSMGDAAFILISTDIKSYLGVSLISFVTAIICGYIVDMLHLDKKLKLRKSKLYNCNCSNPQKTDFEKGLRIDLNAKKHIGHEENDEVDHALHHNEKRKISKLGYKFTHSIGYKIYYLLIAIGFVIMITSHSGGLGHSHVHSHTHTYSYEQAHEEHTNEEEQAHEEEHIDEDGHTHEHEESLVLSIESIIALLGLALSIIYTVLSKKYIKNTTHEEVESKILSFKEMIIHSASETAFVITWIFIGYLVYDLGVMVLGGEEVLHSILLLNGMISVVIGAALGIVPGCGIQIIFISLYSKGIIPFAALVANSISQDGDALFPLIAMDKKSALWATILTTIPAILIGFIVYVVMN